LLDREFQPRGEIVETATRVAIETEQPGEEAHRSVPGFKFQIPVLWRSKGANHRGIQCPSMPGKTHDSIFSAAGPFTDSPEGSFSLLRRRLMNRKIIGRAAVCAPDAVLLTVRLLTAPLQTIY
jgi:hypothetical protein